MHVFVRETIISINLLPCRSNETSMPGTVRVVARVKNGQEQRPSKSVTRRNGKKEKKGS